MRCKACNAQIKGTDPELCEECVDGSRGDYVDDMEFDDETMPFDPTEENIEELLRKL